MIINSVEEPTGLHCVDLICDAAGAFTFKLFRRDPEDQGRWTLVADYSATRYGSEAEAINAAVDKAPWLKEQLKRT